METSSFNAIFQRASKLSDCFLLKSFNQFPTDGVYFETFKFGIIHDFTSVHEAFQTK